MRIFRFYFKTEVFCITDAQFPSKNNLEESLTHKTTALENLLHVRIYEKLEYNQKVVQHLYLPKNKNTLPL